MIINASIKQDERRVEGLTFAERAELNNRGLGEAPRPRFIYKTGSGIVEGPFPSYGDAMARIAELQEDLAGQGAPGDYFGLTA